MRTIITKLPNRRNYRKGRFTVEIGYPWLSYGAIMALEEISTPELDVLEFGAGGSTIFFSRRCRSVKTLDLDQGWVEKVEDALPKPSNVTLLCKDIEGTLLFIKNEPPDSYDIILVDNGSYRCRKMILGVILPLLRVGGYLVLDNYTQRHLRHFQPPPGWDMYTFDDIRYRGTGTKIYKRMI